MHNIISSMQQFYTCKAYRRAQVRVENHYFSTNTPRDHVLFRGRAGGLAGKEVFFSLQELNYFGLFCFVLLVLFVFWSCQFLRAFFPTKRNSFKCFRTLTTLVLCVRLFLFPFGRGYKEKTVTIGALLR